MKDKVLVSLFISFLFIFGILSFLGKREVSVLERRKLMTKEGFKKDFVGNLDTYLSDQFFLRDSLLAINSWYERNVLQNQGHRGVYVFQNSLIEQPKNYDESKVVQFAEKLERIYQTYFLENRVFYSLIPDKGSFLPDNQRLYDQLYQTVHRHLSIPLIDITNEFVLEDYYQTDIHLKQNAYFKVIPMWSRAFSQSYVTLPYEEKTYAPFYGVTLSKVPFFPVTDTISFYELPSNSSVFVNHLEYGKKSIYDFEKLHGLDAYEVFLSGPSALIEIENPNSLTNRELILFRDSFGSSFTPLLVPNYRKITVIDLRYISLEQAATYFSDSADVLFVYSTLLVRDSQLLKVSLPKKSA